MATKTSICVFYMRLAKGEKIFRWLNWAVLIVVDVVGLALTFVNIFQCNPLEAALRGDDAGSKCIDIVTLYLSSAPVNIITDLTLLFLPMPVFTGMRLPRKQKIILVITFGFGAFVAVVDVVRIAYLQRAAISRLEASHNSDSQASTIAVLNDFPWYAALSFMWSAVEVNVGIMCACVPSLKPLVSRIMPRMIRDDDDSSTQKTRRLSDVKPPQPTVDERIAEAGPVETMPIPSPNLTSETSNGPRPSEPLSFEEFLTTQATNGTSLDRRNTVLTINRPENSPFFDFVNVSGPKSMLKLTVKESIRPNAITTILFFLWGFAYGFLDVLNTQFEEITQMTAGESTTLHAMYYIGYLFGSLIVGRWVLKKLGFRATFIAGLCVYACGTLVFWPSAVLTSFPAFVVSNFIVGFGLSILETGANPFIALCGPMEYAETRLNLSQAIQAVGSVVSPLIAKKALFGDLVDAPSLIRVQWTYLGIALFDVLLAVAFYYLPLPGASDDELEEAAYQRHAANSRKVGGMTVIWVTLTIGIIAQFCYVGCQEIVAVSVTELSVALSPNSSNLSGFDFESIGHGLFAFGRFATAVATIFCKPRIVLLALWLGLLISVILTMSLSGASGLSFLMLTYFFESGIFSIIFAISLRGMGAHTKTASALMTAAISGGAIFPLFQFPVDKARGLHYSMCIAIVAVAVGLLFPLYLNFIPAVRAQVDPYVPIEDDTSHADGTSSAHDRNANNRSSGSTENSLAKRIRGVRDRRKSAFRNPDGATSRHVESPEIQLRRPSGSSTYDWEDRSGSASDDSPGRRATQQAKKNSTRNGLATNEEESAADSGGLMHDLAPWPSKA